MELLSNIASFLNFHHQVFLIHRINLFYLATGFILLIRFGLFNFLLCFTLQVRFLVESPLSNLLELRAVTVDLSLAL